MRRSAVSASAFLLLAVIGGVVASTTRQAEARWSTDPEPGQLTIIDRTGKPGDLCPLKGTKVDAEIAGFGARVNVVQTFVNPSPVPIEAVYTFPLPPDAAVDRMRIRIGNRIIEGVIKRKEEARRIYEAAKNAGQAAALLDQERPNIFTQSVANILPNAQVQVEVSYVQVLKYEEGEFEFRFPMVVGPRFLGNATDPEKVAPPITPKGTRTGANIELKVRIDAGAPIQSLQSVLHQVSTQRRGDDRAFVQLSNRAEIPNRDFVLRYRTATDTVQSALITSYDAKKGGYFSLILLPPKAPLDQQIAPREMIFVMDQSGSQSGFPIEKSKELTLKLIRTMRPEDTFNVFGFNNSVRALFDKPQPVNESTMSQADAFIRGMQANGGTQLLEGLNAALRPEKDPQRLRIVVFNTDGYVGDEPQILDTITKTRENTRIFTFGIGNSVNQFLVEAMSQEGKGDSETVYLSEKADEAVERFLRRTRSPILTDITAAFEGMVVKDVVPQAIPDVFSEKPIVIMGRFEHPGRGRLVLSGRLGGQPWSQTLNMAFTTESGNSSIPSLWARRKVDQIQRTSYLSMLKGGNSDRSTRAIVDVALEHGIMTQYTSFVAVEPRVVNVGGKQYTVRVPVEMADGVSYEDLADKEVAINARLGSTVSGRTTLGLYRGGGGFGGGAGGPAGAVAKSASNLPATVAPPSRIARLEMREAERASTPQEIRKANYESKVDTKLRAAKGKVAVIVWLTSADPKIIAALKKQGLMTEQVDSSLKLVFGVCQAGALERLAQLAEVQRIEPLK